MRARDDIFRARMRMTKADLIAELQALEARVAAAGAGAQAADRPANDRLAEFNAVIENVEYGILFMDAELRARIVNRAFREMWGMPAAFVAGGPTMLELMAFNRHNGIYDVADEEWDAYTRARIEAVRRGDVPPMELRRADGRILQYRCIALPGGWRMLTYLDVTPLKEKERALLEAKEQAEAANRSKSDFLANMSHELRTPLNAIIGFAEIILRESFGALGNARYRDYLGDIHASAAHLLNLINDILDLSKIEAGKLELHEDAVDIVAATETCLRIVRARAVEGGVRLGFEPAAALPRLYCDERAIKQVILNLLSNAVKFTPRGGRVHVEAGIDSRGWLAIAVADTGIGIAKEDIRDALAPFGQIDTSMSRQHRGTGLGLPLVKSLVECHGGTFTLDSAPGEGTTAVARFPPWRVSGAGPATPAAGTRHG